MDSCASISRRSSQLVPHNAGLIDEILSGFSNAICPNRPYQNEYRKRAVQVRNVPVFALLRRGKECGVRPNLISILAQHRAPSQHDPPAFI
jgi:hypothetical protein